MRCVYCPLLLTIVIASRSHAHPDDFLIERVALTGEPVPGIEGAIWVGLGAPLIDGQGNLLFLAAYELDGDVRLAYFYGPPDAPELVLETGQIAPGYDDPCHTIIDLDQGNLAEDGTMALWVETGEPGSFPYGPQHIYTGRPGDLTLALYQEDPAPDSPEGATFVDFSEVRINAKGEIATWGWVILPEGEDTTRKSVLAGSPDELKVVAQGYGLAPDIEGGATFLDGFVPWADPVYNDLGWASFTAYFEGPLVDDSNDYAFFSGSATDLRLVARLGGQALGFDEGVVFNSFFFSLIRADVNGNVSFIANVEGPGIDATNDAGVWCGPRTAAELVPQLREGLEPPGTTDATLFTGFDDIRLNNRSRLLTVGYLGGGDVDDSNDIGYWSGPRQEIRLILREGEQAPELPDGVTVIFDNGEYGSSLYKPRTVSNDRDDMLMVCPLSGAVDDSNDRALYYRSSLDHQWRLVARTGDIFDGQTIGPDEGINQYMLELGEGTAGYGRSLDDEGRFGVIIGFGESGSGYGVYRITPAFRKNSLGDSDEDGDVDLLDYAEFQICFGSDSSECVSDFDFDDNSAVDLFDYSSYLSVRTRPH